MGVSENSGFYHQIIHFNRVFHYLNHPFWGTPIFGNTHIIVGGIYTWSLWLEESKQLQIWCWGKDPKSFSAACEVHTAVSRDRNPTTNMFFREKNAVYPRKLTWQWKDIQLKMYLLFKMVIFHCHVSFLGGTPPNGSYLLNPGLYNPGLFIR